MSSGGCLVMVWKLNSAMSSGGCLVMVWTDDVGLGYKIILI
jgi:hypothetical protein